MKHLSRFIFENSFLTPFWTSICSGYLVIGFDGRAYLSEAGAEYLESLSS